MYGRALSAALLLAAALIPCSADAQVTWQATAPPLVTAENETWFRAGQAIEWNGEFYYPAGAAEAFNRYQMVRSGSYRGIPLYTDATLEPYSIVFVPIAGGRMQPYERPRTGMLAGSVGSRASQLPSGAAGTSGLTLTNDGFVTQAAAPPTFARAYDLAPAAPAVVVATAKPAPQPAPVPAATAGTTGRTAPPATAATSGRVTTVTNRSSKVAPKGINGIWLDYDGRRWVSAGKAVDVTDEFTRIGTFRGFPVYQRRGDSLTIYVPSAGDLVVPFRSTPQLRNSATPK